MTQSKSLLLAFDFDGTIAQTFVKGPLGMDVHTAYEKSIYDLFGDAGLSAYSAIGGLRNRAPSDLIHALLDNEHRTALVAAAEAFFQNNRDRMVQLVSADKGHSLDISDRTHPEPFITELLVRQKLQYLSDQIGMVMPDTGERWPQQCRGFGVFWKHVQELKADGMQVKTAIISSGHDEFIRKTFATWDLPLPDYMVTEDDIRGRRYPEEMDRRVKPGTLQMALVHRMWMRDLGLTGKEFDMDTAAHLRDRIWYFGDDIKKDGGLAENSRIVFGLIVPGPGAINDGGLRSFQFEDWQEVADVLEQARHSLTEEGTHIRDVLYCGGYWSDKVEGRSGGKEML